MRSLNLSLSSLMVFGLCFAPVRGRELDEVAQSVKRDLDSALAELAALREEMANEKIPLARRVDELERQVLAKRRERDRVQRSADNKAAELGALRSEVRALKDEHDYISGLFSEYVRTFETRIHICEVDRYQEAVQETHAASANADLTFGEKSKHQLALVGRAMDRLENLMGGEIFPGRALSPAGVLEEGQFALVGPYAVFASASGESAGLARLQLGFPKPTVVDLGPESTESIQAITSAGRGRFPLDPSLGNALKIAATKDSFLEHIRKGGPVMAPILALGVAAVVIAILKWIQLSRITPAHSRDLQVILSHLQSGNSQQALRHASGIKGIIGEMLATAITHSREKKQYLEEILYERMLNVKPRLELMLPVIALTAATAPLLGLLGTVTGMINTFNMITVFGTGDPRMLSGGISEALITTKFGLIVAVPALICHAIVSRKAKGILGGMEQITVAFINGVPSPKKFKE